jgi:hypothetical protein
MKTIISNIEQTTTGLNPVARAAVYATLTVILCGVVTLLIGLAVQGAPAQFAY